MLLFQKYVPVANQMLIHLYLVFYNYVNFVD